MKSRRGFTLIEVLVVVAIIGLLAGILLPSLSAARRQSRKSVCIHNLHEIGVALQAYMVSNKDTFPSCAALPSDELDKDADDRLPGLPVALKNEVGRSGLTRTSDKVDKSHEVFLCPSDENREQPELGGRRYFDTEGTSYHWETLVNGLRVGFKSVPFIGGTNVPLREMPILSDFENFHRTSRNTAVANRLYADLHVDTDNP